MNAGMVSKRKLRSTLRERFGLEEFRAGQEELIGAILDGRDTLAIMPTGAGKSLIYQLPALLLDGLTLVVSPLIALMKDQTDKLEELGVDVLSINSGLTTREQTDFTIALLDAWAALADVLTFYQERLANESWLRTARERDSILRLAELIGYRLKPGVAAETPLSFSLDETPGAPTQVAVEIGTKVQSVPGDGEKPQMFETVEPLDARVEWNALTPVLTTTPVIASGVTSLDLKGTSTNLLRCRSTKVFTSFTGHQPEAASASMIS